MIRPTLSEFIRVMDITYQEALWGLVWILIFWGLYTGLVIGYATVTARQRFIKNELPRIYKNKLQKMMDENKELKAELRTVTTERREYLDRLDVIKNSSEVKR